MMVQDLESITIYFKLLTIKSLHAKLVMGAYNHMKSSIGKDICLKGWKKVAFKGHWKWLGRLIWTGKVTMVISLMYLLKMIKETIRRNTISVFAMSQSFLLLRYFEDEKEKPFSADYFICRNFDKNT